jgi:uncharacterized protein YjcR
MKQGEGKDIAHDLYVYQQMTYDEIASRTGRSEKTIRTWSSEGDWSGERERELRTRVHVHEKLHTLVQKLTDRMIKDCDAQTELSPQSLHALTNLVNSMHKLYQYEGDKQADAATDSSEKLTPDAIADRVKELLGA